MNFFSAAVTDFAQNAVEFVDSWGDPNDVLDADILQIEPLDRDHGKPTYLKYYENFCAFVVLWE
jgi:hypothetical protein